MEVEVRMVRARVWLSSSLFHHQDGILSLTRVGEIESVAHATIRSVEGKQGEQYSLAEVAQQQGQQKCFRTVTVAWEEQSSSLGSSCPKFTIPESMVTPVHGRPKRKTNQQTSLPRLDFQLFILRPRSRGGTLARSRPQTMYIGKSGWQLSEKDVEALISSREVVFLTTLQDDLGTLEVKLRCVSSSDSSRAPVKGLPLEDEAEVPTRFNINWSSSEALQKDLAEKARLKAEADKKLIAQLKQTASKEAKLVETRDYLLVHLHRSRAASRIQRRCRLLQRRKQEALDKLRQEEEARIAAKKAKVRDKVISRNRKRALAMRTQLLDQHDNDHFSFSTYKIRPEDSPSVRIAEKVETERAKLKQRLAVLEMERQRFIANMRGNSTTSSMDRRSQHSRDSDKLFDDELVRAVQELHFTHTYSLLVHSKHGTKA